MSKKYQSIERKLTSEKKRKSPESLLLINQLIPKFRLIKNNSLTKNWEDKRKNHKKNLKRNKPKLKKDKKEWILKNNEQILIVFIYFYLTFSSLFFYFSIHNYKVKCIDFIIETFIFHSDFHCESLTKSINFSFFSSRFFDLKWLEVSSR